MKNITGPAAKKIAEEILENNDWKDGYQFRFSDMFFLRKPEVVSGKKEVIYKFTVEYRTKAHKVVNHVQWKYRYNKIAKLFDDMENLEQDIFNKTSDPDRTDQVFGPRFSNILFKEKNYSGLGWIIKK